MTQPHPPIVALATLGCKVNQAETEDLARRFSAAGWTIAGFDDPADAYILNSCTVTHVADRKGRQLLRQARRRAPAALVAVTGCYATTDGASLAALDGVDLVIPNNRKAGLVALVSARLGAGDRLAAGPARAHTRTRAFVKVQDGCDHFCAYCIVPFARGKPVSTPVDDVVARVRSLTKEGYREVVLTGVHLGLYQIDGAALADLVRVVLQRTPIERLRLSSIEPQDFAADLLDLWDDPRLCPHLHLPLQSGSDAVLRRMGRRYTAAGFAALVERARSAIPGLAVTADIIAGLPGEGEEEHCQSLEFARAMGFARMHVFPYSPRKGTRAAAMDGQVPPEVRLARARELTALSALQERAFAASQVGKVVDVLWEQRLPSPDGGRARWTGHAPNYLRVTAESDAGLSNTITPVRVTRSAPGGAFGEIVSATE